MRARAVLTFTAISGVALLGAFVYSSSGLAPEDVPAWFQGDGSDPYAAYSAWAQLSDPDAMVSVGAGFTAIGGVLQDKSGEPIANCPLLVESGNARGREFSVWLQTDDAGRFVLYGVRHGPGNSGVNAEDVLKAVTGKRRAVRLLEAVAFRIQAAPGYPPTSLGRRFATQNDAWRDCTIESIGHPTDDQTFVIASCRRSDGVSPQAFATFKAGLAKSAPAGRGSDYRSKPRRWIENENRGIENRYRVRIVDAEGKSVAGANVGYMATDWIEGNVQTVETDAEGRAVLEEHLSRSRPLVKRALSIDVPGGAVGPADPTLSLDRENVLQISPAATVRGRLVDHRGKPYAERVDVSVRYVRDDVGLSFELRADVAADGRFAFDRIMPGEAFALVAQPRNAVHATPRHWRLNPMLEGQSVELTLEPGEVREGVEIAVLAAAPLRGVVVNEPGEEVTEARIEWSRPHSGPDKWSYWESIGEGGPAHGSSPAPAGSRFGDLGLSTLPFKFRVTAPGYESVITEPVTPVPGEMIFVKIVLK